MKIEEAKQLQKDYPELLVHYVDKTNNEKWKKPKVLRELNETELMQFNLRRQLPNEIVIDLENPDLYFDILSKLYKHKISYYSYKTGSKGYYLHVLFTDLPELNDDLRYLFRKKFIESFGGDTRLTSEKQWIAVEDRPHFKTLINKTHYTSGEYSGSSENSISKSIFCRDLLDEAKEELRVKVDTFDKGALENEDFNEFDKDPFLQYALNNKITEGRRNDVLFKNLAIGLVKSGKSNIEILGIARKIVRNCPGKEIGEFMGWVNKVVKGEIKDYNKWELNKWADENNHSVERYPTVGEFDFRFDMNTSGPVSVGELVLKRFPPVKWYIKPFVSDNSLVMFFGNPMSYKSWCAIHAGLCIALGKPLFDKFETVKGKVLYLDNETDEREMQRRIKILSKGMNLTLTEENELFSSFFYYNPISMISDKGGNPTDVLVEISRFIKENKMDLVIVDSYREFISHDENDSRLNSVFLNSIKKIIKGNDVSFVFIHHKGKENESSRLNNKMNKARGSSQIIASMRNMLSFSYKDNSLFEVEHVKSNLHKKEEKAFEIEAIWSESEDSLKLVYKGEAKEDKKRYLAEECAEAIIVFADSVNEFKRKDLEIYLNETHGSRFKGNTITNALKLLIDSERLENPRFGYYKLIN